MFGQLSHELEINVPASEAWELYGTLRLAKLLEEDGTLIQKFELTEGDGGIGTILKLTFPPGTSKCMHDRSLINVFTFVFLNFFF